MAESGAILHEYKRYESLIRAELEKSGPALAPLCAARGQEIYIERGLVYPSALLNPEIVNLSPADFLVVHSTSDGLSSIPVIDHAGHRRPVYTGLLIYSLLQTCRIAHSRGEIGLRPWCDMLESKLTRIDWPDRAMPASRGGDASEGAWMALALFVAGKVFAHETWTKLASDTFGRLLRGSSDRSTFLIPSPSDNLETLWYHELTILHAAASYALQADDRALSSFVTRNTEYHLNETQPDHATSQPLGLFAFICNPKTHMLADQMLHTCSVQRDGVSLILLADALYCLRLLG